MKVNVLKVLVALIATMVVKHHMRKKKKKKHKKFYDDKIHGNAYLIYHICLINDVTRQVLQQKIHTEKFVEIIIEKR